MNFNQLGVCSAISNIILNKWEGIFSHNKKSRGRYSSVGSTVQHLVSVQSSLQFSRLSPQLYGGCNSSRHCIFTASLWNTELEAFGDRKMVLICLLLIMEETCPQRFPSGFLLNVSMDGIGFQKT